MNLIYSLVWSESHSKYVVAHEKTRARGRAASSRVAGSVASVLLSVMLMEPAAWAAPPTANTLPTGGQVTAGTATMSTSGNTMSVQQSTQRAAINWTNFSIGSNATVNFEQPNASAVMLNRVVGNEQSIINGALNANGQVFVLNSNGVLFNQSAQVNVGGLVASTLNMSDADFMAGRNTFASNGSRASVINLGQITTANGGYVALLGNQVSNQGLITARLGTAALAAGDRISLNFNGNSLVGVSVDQGTLNAMVENQQAIIADGGVVVLTAKGADTVLASVVNNTGEIRAQTVANKEGKIYLLGDMETGTAQVAGILDASAPHGGNGGFIETSAAHVKIADGVHITTQSTNGQSGTWLIDPADFTIAASGGDISGTTLSGQLGSSNVTIQSTNGTVNTTGNGDIFVNDNVTWTSGHALTLNAYRNINIGSTIDASSGSGGSVNLYYGQGSANGTINGTEASYDFGLTSAGFAGKINLQAGQNFNTKLGSSGTVTNWTVITQLGLQGDETTNPGNSLQGLAATANLSGNFVLGANIDASATSAWNTNSGFTPIGVSPGFTGKFDGLGHTIQSMYINRPADNGVGLFGYVGGSASVRDIGLINPVVTGQTAVGALVGFLGYYGTSDAPVISKTFATGVNVTATFQEAGGLIGDASGNSSISNTFTSGFVTTGPNGGAGGLVGDNESGSVITNSYSSANVTGTYIGGFAGWNAGVIRNSYSTGTVGTSNSPCTDYCGGFVGEVSTMSVISNSYSIGRVYASGSTSGAFAGYIDPTFRTYHAGTVTASFWDSVTSGQTSGFGSGSDLSYVDALSQAGGLTTTNMQVLATYNGTANWDIVGDPSLSVNYPQLRWATSGLNAGNSIWVMRGVASSGGGNQTSSDDVERAVTTAIHTPTTVVPPYNPLQGTESKGDAKSFTNVVNVPSTLGPELGKDDPLAVLSSPRANEPTQAVSLADARMMLNPVSSDADGSGGGAPGGDREVRAPASRNSLVEIVNGGVKLPTGVEQQLFVVKSN